ncbi:FKBP-type peptidyl-prolyl cis-trans isomerase [Algibacter mikhailovii]|uniref:FKBP-type peptidyl-prolyl cis-trans isomerase n=1 Tax=Algibacter mikhailovii TaxID=425498 RepID=UPI0031E6CECE
MKHILVLLTLVLFASCSSDDTSKDYTSLNEEEIKAYITANNLTAQRSNSGLYYVIDEPGIGENPISTDRVKVSYKGYYTDGTVFDESDDEGISFFLQNVISGWAEGLTYFQEGGSGKLLIPSHLAYGSIDYNNIPGGSVLIFDIELIYVNYVTENDQQINSYLSANNLEAQKTDSGLYYIIDEPGDGAQVTLQDEVSLTYKGYFTNEQVFDESASSVNFNLANLIPGFAEGLTKFKEGGSGTLFIPSHLAYGNSAIGGLPAGSVLIFDVEVISVN